ncbi:MAG: SCO family protein [Chloroflexota bacterium]
MSVQPISLVPTKVTAENHSALLYRIIYLVLGLWLVIVIGFSVFQPIKVLPRVNLAPGFVMTNQSGERRTSEDYRGKLTLYSFFYSKCLINCPPVMDELRDLRAAFDAIDRSTTEIGIVTISLDPVNDTPQVLNQFMSRYQSVSGKNTSWDFLTGNQARLKNIVGGGFNVYYDAPSGSQNSQVKFDPHFVLVDGWGIIRADYPGYLFDQKIVIRDINYLISEIKNSKGVGRYAYEAAHLFRCYP